MLKLKMIFHNVCVDTLKLNLIVYAILLIGFAWQKYFRKQNSQRKVFGNCFPFDIATRKQKQ